MEYTELSRRTETIIKTLVEMTFIIGEQIIVENIEISHFNPKDEAEITLGIENRYNSRERELNEQYGS